jgi:hypothetical protein
MKRHFGKEEHYVDHALKVTGFAEEIMAGEAIDEPFFANVIRLAGIFHDVGIPVAMIKHGTSAGPLQEREGEPIAHELMAELGVRRDIAERVAYIVGKHHTREAVDGLDFQVIWEADALVNIPNGWGRRDYGCTFAELVDANFRTKTGSDLINAWGQQNIRG